MVHLNVLESILGKGSRNINSNVIDILKVLNAQEIREFEHFFPIDQLLTVLEFTFGEFNKCNLPLVEKHQKFLQHVLL